jgi:omega-amidase
MTLKVALIQTDIAYGDPKKNYENMEAKIELAASNGTDIVVLPELWTTGYDLTRLDEIADPEGQESQTFLSYLAKEYNVHIVGGSIAKASNGDVTNTMYIVERSGKVIKEYSKAHLFRLMDEEKYLIEGKEQGGFPLENISCAGVICYDIRFPEWIRTHMIDEAKVLFVVAEWPIQRIDHWRALLISRAIENQCFVVACNRIGADPKNTFGGHSIIIGPWGDVIAEANEDETILVGEIEVDEVEKVRNTIPIFSDRRPDLYKL